MPCSNWKPVTRGWAMVVGASWEGLVIENLLKAAGEQRRASFFHTADGAKIDLLLERGGEAEMAIEIKRSTAPSPVRGFAIACDDLVIAQLYLAYPSTERFPLRHGTQAIGLAELMQQVQ